MRKESVTDDNWEFPVGHRIWCNILKFVYVIITALMYRTRIDHSYIGNFSSERSEDTEWQQITVSMCIMPGKTRLSKLQEITDQQPPDFLSLLQLNEQTQLNSIIHLFTFFVCFSTEQPFNSHWDSLINSLKFYYLWKPQLPPTPTLHHFLSHFSRAL